MEYELISERKWTAYALLDQDQNIVSHSVEHRGKTIDFKIGKTIGDTRKLNGLTYDQTVNHLDALGYKIVWEGDKAFLAKTEEGQSVKRW